VTENGQVPSVHAGVVTRLLAAGVDTAVVVLVTVFVDLGAAGIRFVWSPRDFRWPQPGTQLAVLVLFVVAVVYLTASWSMAGRTYGDRLLGLRVLSGRYRKLGPARSLLRALLCVLFPVGLLWSGISATRRSLQDLVVRTVVVYDVRSTVAVPAVHPRPVAEEFVQQMAVQQASVPRTSPPVPREPSETEPSRP
jgi:uncharacterized RDD family membrane protein YckC